MKSQFVSYTCFLTATPVNLLGSSFSFVPSSLPHSRNEVRTTISIAPFDERASKSRNRNRYDGLFMSDSADESDATKDDTIIIRSLEASLQANGIQVPDEETVQNLLDQREWIYPSERVADLRKKLNQEQLYSIFNYQHHLQSAKLLFDFIQNQDSCVVYGHKVQGKTQFLFFVFKLLQAMGEKVLFLDRTILPLEYNNKIGIDSVTFCGHLWKDSFLQLGGVVTDTLETFYNDARPESFGEFLFALDVYTGSSKSRIWIIIDEVVLFEKFPIRLPKEQDMGPFNWIITGSAGIGSWVAERHLGKLVFDLPLFTKNASIEFAARLCNELDINLELAIGVPPAGIGDWLEERFGGVVGYIAELCLEISKGGLASQYISSLYDRINEIFLKVAQKSHISRKQLAEDLLNEIKQRDNKWLSLRNAGLCGSSAPRGVIFSLFLSWLYSFYPGEDFLSLISRFRSKFSDDAGLDGCLLELEEILKLRAGRSIQASLIKSSNQTWIADKSIALPTMGSSVNVFEYNEEQGWLEPSLLSTRSSWNVIEVPCSFDVIDVVLVNNANVSSVIYGIQITRTPTPFRDHHTFDTCTPQSREKLDNLWRVISKHFNLEKKRVKKFYLMLAPNCKPLGFSPRIEHSSNYYFSPLSAIPEYDPSKMKKRTKSKQAPASIPINNVTRSISKKKNISDKR